VNFTAIKNTQNKIGRKRIFKENNNNNKKRISEKPVS
jgi:hypothetical protein